VKKYVIEGLADACPLCIEPGERSKEKRPPVFAVSCEGGYSGPVCAPHLAALLKTAAGPASAPKAEPPKPVPPAPPGPPAAAAPVNNGPAESVKK
jgi:hypothetical protein